MEENWSLGEFLERLKTLVSIDSGSEDREGVARVAETLEGWFRELGYRGGTVDFGSAAGCGLEMRNFDGEDIDLLLLGHMDTVFPRGTAERRPFRVEDGVGYGPGVADMKAGLVAAFFLARALRGENLRICAAFNGSEETGSVHSCGWMQELSGKSRYCILFEPGRPGNVFVKERKGIAEYAVRFQGVAAHSGVEPEKGASAVAEMARWITELSAMSDYESGLSVNVGVASGGQATNMVPDYAELKMEVRFLDPAHSQRVRERLLALRDRPFDGRVRAEVEEISGCPPMRVNAGTEEMIGHLEALCREMGLEVDFIRTGGGSDANFVSAAGAAVLDGCGPIGANLHSEREYLDVSSIPLRLELMYRLAHRLFALGG